jgi:alanine racemase
MNEVAGIAVDEGADWLCVNNLGEGVRLREAGFTVPVLVMGFVPPREMDSVVEHDLRPVVYEAGVLDALEAAAARRERTAAFHLKIETGTHRQGITEEGLPAFTSRIRRLKWAAPEGIYTHFANIEDTTDHSFAESQMAEFERICARVEEETGSVVPMRHSACSAATLLFDRTHMHLVRVGISLYGMWPSSETFVSCRERGVPAPGLSPVMTWKSTVAQVKTVPEGSFIGYGCTYRATRRTRIAVLPVGYSEGYDRRLSGVAHVLIRGRRAPVRGRVCMNMCMVDVTDIDGAAGGDEVVLLGAQGDESIRAEQLARWCGTISYEVVSRISPDIPRVVV